ncbi:isochorismatase family protein [Chromobacterium alkanivorans]|uniref:isochorismatase family protein n=1 Tax=Chromobacterium alkanivorans TaxID=1071719 RepID=UPI00196868EB|nr:isochorismatase family protein [Chromobacterium alkanivorans]MBN3006605.1 isochorismatase family protein [Chromobacterium alkanivorans]
MLQPIKRVFSGLALLSSIVAGGSMAGGVAEASGEQMKREGLTKPLPPSSGKAALLMVEFVNEWLAPDGKLRGLMQDQELFSQSQIAAQRALAAARQAGMPVIHASLQLSSDYRELGRVAFGLRGAIPRAGTWQRQHRGWQFYPPFAPRPNEFVVSGRAGASAFAASDLDNYLRGQGISRLYLAGYATQVCIESTLRAAHDLGYEPVVLAEATAAFNAAQQQYFLNDIVHHFGWAVSTEDFIANHAAASESKSSLFAVVDSEGLPEAMLRSVQVPGAKIPGVSSAVGVESGRLLLLSGQVPVAGDGTIATTLKEQLEQVFLNMDATLRQGGSGWKDVARMTIYVKDYRPEWLATIREVRDRWLQSHEPASALIGVQALFRPEVQVEIDAIAVRGAPPPQAASPGSV